MREHRVQSLTVPVVDTIFLDAGGVLVWPNWTRISEAFQLNGIHVDPAALAAADPFVRRSLDVQDLIAAGTDQRRGWNYFERLVAAAGIVPAPAVDAALATVAEYQRTTNIWEHVPEFVQPALTELRRLGHTLVVVSNANGTLKQAFTRLGLAPLVDVIIDSAEEGFEKPDPRLFERALKRSGARAEKTLHVGDFYHIDVVGARAAGLTAVLVDEANLYAQADCDRIPSIANLPQYVGHM
jgi:putative hydrolase of the HAD superfamily